MARIPQETIDRIRDSADIVDVVSRHVDLKNGGVIFSDSAPSTMKKRPHSPWRRTKASIIASAAGMGAMR